MANVTTNKEQEADNVMLEVNALIERLRDILDDLENARDRGPVGVFLLLDGQFGIDNILNDRLAVDTTKLRKAVEYYDGEEN